MFQKSRSFFPIIFIRSLSRIRRFATCGVSCAFALVLSVPFAATPLAAQQAPLIRVGTGPDDQATPLVYADKAGLFKKAGLNVEIDRLPGAAAVAAALAGGSLEVGKASSLGAITAIAKGLPFTIIGNMAFYDAKKPDLALLVAANSNVKTAKDLAGQTLAAVSLQDMNSVSTFKWLEDRGVDHTSPKYVEIPASAALPAMEANRIVGSMVYEPYFTAFVASGKVRVLGYPFSSIGNRFSDAVLFATRDWTAAHPDLVQRFLKVVSDASNYVATHESEVAPMIAQFGGLEPSAVEHIHHASRGIAIKPSDLQPVIDVAAKYKVIPSAFPAEDIICSCALVRR
jgi:NitT/TauT family transport system substrate-binding protein